MSTNTFSAQSRFSRFSGVALTAALAGALLSGCASTDPAGAGQQTSSEAPAAELHVKDAWIKAAKDGMTGGFAELHNMSDTPKSLVSVSSDAAKSVELHDTTGTGGAMSMKPLDGPLVIAPNASVNLEPGGKHIMFMDLKQELKPGTSINVTLNFEDKSTQVVEFEIKDFSGAKESYAPEADHGSH